MKLLIETGSESHTTSYASVKALYHGGEYDGQQLYQIRHRQITTEWFHPQNGTWVKTIYEIPGGTEIEIIAKSYTGNIHRVYRLDASAGVLDSTIDVGLRRCQIKGRLVLVKDVSAAQQIALKHAQEEDF